MDLNISAFSRIVKSPGIGLNGKVPRAEVVLVSRSGGGEGSGDPG